MPHLFETNLALLDLYDPLTAKQIRTHEPSGNADVVSTPNGEKTLRLKREGKEFLLHSGQDPTREAERWASSLENEPVYNVMVYGCGLFHHIFQLIRKYGPTLRNFAIIERDMDVLHAAFQHVNLAPLLRTKATFFYVGEDASGLRKFMNDHLTPFILDGIKIIEHSSSLQAYPEYYDRVKGIVRESLQSGEVLLRTKVELGGIIQENIVRNLPTLLNTPNISAIYQILTDIPAFIVGAGPSLDRNIEQLSQIEGKGVVIACDTVLAKLRNHGITPDIMISTDPTYLNEKHFRGMEELGETVFVYSPSVYYPILQKLKGTKVNIPLASSRILSTLKEVFGNTSTIKTGVNVGQTCFNLARFLGCDPIVLTGLDFSFSPQGGKTHTSETALQRNIYVSETPGKMKVELITEKPELEEFEPILIPGNQQETVATNKFWFAYLRSMEEEIRSTQAKVINCTEGGAKIQGAEVDTLANTISQYCTTDHKVRDSLQMAVGFFFGMYQEEGKAVLDHSLKILDTALEQAEKGIQLVQELEEMKNAESASSQVRKSKMNEIMDTHEALVQKQMIYVVLDEAADRILKPFLKQASRLQGNEPTPENVQKAVERYRPYFAGMKDLCAYFRKVYEDSMGSMDQIDVF